MPHKYDNIVQLLAAAFTAIREIGLREVLAKGGVGEILLAHKLGHEIIPTDKGADGIDASGVRYEYKVSATNQLNFHFGTRETRDPPAQKVRRHFAALAGAYCAVREGERFTRIVYCPSAPLVTYLVAHFASTTGTQLNKNFSIQRFAELTGATEVPCEDA
ncbi:hypothetical protein WME76_22735 [Sorangium sp. So ce119]|uniref:hypothetical protein n=1 Tax=Sorangium sp. So ce119 TaxID=3133279 RepID=UPI003F62FBDC